ncbi:MAG: P-II family nitrogen regulator [Clostridiales bacterium]|jgi:nitrogen regulatory protein PII 2|nr:P-II family nitrogen regulator [Eubacteriales bacterium]MDH7567200.1 P-II family nitrogen regulator [Clostridiales bacterium]
MKEVLAVIRMNKVNQTKEALALEGFPALNCRKVMGRGKKKVNYELIDDILSSGAVDSPVIAESLSEGHRLIPKRLLSIVVRDSDVEKVVETIIGVNQTGNPGDGKIFVMPVFDAVRVRTGESGEKAI